MYKKDTETVKQQGKYDDIIDLSHHVSETRKRMSMIDRAAQFSPFAALVGYEAAVEETARLTEDKIELTEDSKLRISDTLGRIIAARDLGKDVNVVITYFVPDQKKDGGAYVNKHGVIKYFDEYKRNIIMCDKTVIPISNVWDIEIQ